MYEYSILGENTIPLESLLQNLNPQQQNIRKLMYTYPLDIVRFLNFYKPNER